MPAPRPALSLGQGKAISVIQDDDRQAQRLGQILRHLATVQTRDIRHRQPPGFRRNDARDGYGNRVRAFGEPGHGRDKILKPLQRRVYRAQSSDLTVADLRRLYA